MSRGFASDNYAGAHPAVLAAVGEANAGHAGAYGGDGWTARLEDVNERLRVLRALQRKYGAGEEAILAFADDAARRLGGLSTADEERGALEAECSELAERAATLAAGVSDARRKAAPALAEALEGELEELGMEGVSLRVELAPEPDLGPVGSEREPIGAVGRALEGLDLHRIEPVPAQLRHRHVSRDADGEPHEAIRPPVGDEPRRHLPDADQRLLQNGLRVHARGEGAEAVPQPSLGAGEPAGEGPGVAGADGREEIVEALRHGHKLVTRARHLEEKR